MDAKVKFFVIASWMARDAERSALYRWNPVHVDHLKI
jgi:hypothetical protein